MNALERCLISTIAKRLDNISSVFCTIRAYQNSIDSFSHAAFIQQKYVSRFPGFKVILFLDQVRKVSVLVVVHNGFGKRVDKPKKSYLGEEYGDDIVSKIIE